MKSRKTIGLALGSGGVRGLAHVGVIKALRAHDIPIDFIAGSSIGAFVGAHYALFQDIEALETLTIGNKLEKINVLFELSLNGGVAGGDKLKKMLTHWLGAASFDDVCIPLSVIATDLNKKKTHVFSRGSLISAVQASMAIPGMFKPVVYQGRALVDGGVSNPVPTNVVRAMGADIVIGVNLYTCLEDTKKNRAIRLGFLEISKRTIEIMRYYLAKNDVMGADIVVEPAVEKFASWIRYFVNMNSHEIVREGEHRMKKMIPRLRSLLMET